MDLPNGNSLPPDAAVADILQLDVGTMLFVFDYLHPAVRVVNKP